MTHYLKKRNLILLIVILGFAVGHALIFTDHTTASDDSVNNNTLRVAPNGNDSSSCGSTTEPCKNIQYAINNSEPGDTILVAAGTYTYSNNSDFCQAWYGTTGVLCIESNNARDLTILGGFTTDNWSQADPDKNVTIIDGGHVNRGIFVLQTAVGPVTLHMEGFTIRNGLARGIPTRGGNDAIYSFGGGMFADGANTTHNLNITLKHMVFENNISQAENTTSGAGGTAAGGGVVLRSTDNTLLEHITFSHNEARAGSGPIMGGYAVGGGLYLHEKSKVTAQHLVFIENKAIGGFSNGPGRINEALADAQGGGATIHSGSSLTLQHGTFVGNQAIGGYAPNGDGGGSFGGGMKVEGEPWANKNSVVNLIDVTFTENEAIGGNGINGGVVGGGAIESIHSNVNMANSIVVNNIAQGGNGSNNQGPAGGGGGYFQNLRETPSNISIGNSIFADNIADTGTGNIKGGGGAGIWLQGVDAYIIHTTVARNLLGKSYMQGSGILVMNDGAQRNAAANISYSIIAEHAEYPDQLALHVKPGNSATLYRGLFADNSKNAGGGGIINGLSSMLEGSADFVSPGAPNYDYHIKKNSSAINQATDSPVTIDIDGESREVYASPDIGADEYIPIILSVSPVSDGKLLLNWVVNPGLEAEVSKYHVVFSSESGANNPTQGASPINVGDTTNFTLSGLTNYKEYTFHIEAYDQTNTLLDSSNNVVAVPTDRFVYLPAITR